ncbi:hypothetical protein D3C76_1421570 [compost metagenome]
MGQAGNQGVHGVVLGVQTLLDLLDAQVELGALVVHGVEGRLQAILALGQDATRLGIDVQLLVQPGSQAVVTGEETGNVLVLGAQYLVQLGVVDLQRAVLLGGDTQLGQVRDAILLAGWRHQFVAHSGQQGTHSGIAHQRAGHRRLVLTDRSDGR